MNEEVKEKKKFYKTWYGITLIVICLIIVVSAVNGTKEQANVVSTTPTPETQTQATQKQYQEIFNFSGNGAKKSEPFTITGDRFKIAYDCKGDPSATLCTAFVFKVGSTLPQSIMNSGKATKDETIIYSSMAGKGEYYIDANVLGSFTMTVYDYK